MQTGNKVRLRRGLYGAAPWLLAGLFVAGAAAAQTIGPPPPISGGVACTGDFCTATAPLSGDLGGTGVVNTSKTITLGGNLVTSGAFASIFTMTGATGVTFPTSGTLATTGAANIPLTALAAQATNTVVGNTTSGSASPTALAVGSCSSSSSALIWTTNTGFGCNTGINATTLSGAAIGTSGATIPLLSTANSWSLGQTITTGRVKLSATGAVLNGLEVLSGASGSLTGLALGRTADEMYFGVAGASAQWDSNAVAGDGAVVTAANMFFNTNGGSGAGSLEVVAANGAVILRNEAAAGVGATFACLATTGAFVSGATCAASTQRIKTNIHRWWHGLDYLLQMGPDSWIYNAEAGPSKEGHADVGQIAEKLAAIDPVLALWGADGTPLAPNDRAIAAVMVNSLQQLLGLIAAAAGLLGFLVCRKKS